MTAAEHRLPDAAFAGLSLDRSVERPLNCEIDVLEPFRDPAGTYDFVADGIAGLLHDTLFRLKADGGVTGNLARAWMVRGRNWTIDLAKDRFFADGSSILASHVVAALDAFGRIGARRWLRLPIAEAVAITEHRVLIRTARPIGYLRELLSCVVFAPRAADPTVESGPYRLAKAHPLRRGVLLVRDGPSPSADAVGPRWLSLVRTADAQQGVRLFRQGRIDLTCGTIFPHADAADAGLRPALRTHPSLLVGQLLPNTTRVAGLADPVARRALSLAIDRRRLAAELAPVLEPCHGLLDCWTGEGDARAYSPAAAKALWTVAGRPLRHLTISYADFPPNGDLLERVAHDFSSVLSLDVELKKLDYHAHVAACAEGDYQIAYAIHPPAFADPVAALLPFAVPGALPYAAAPPSAFYSALAAVEAHVDPLSRRGALHRVAACLDETMPTIPLVRTRICQLVRDGLHAPVLASGFPDFAAMRWTHA